MAPESLRKLPRAPGETARSEALPNENGPQGSVFIHYLAESEGFEPSMRFWHILP